MNNRVFYEFLIGVIIFALGYQFNIIFFEIVGGSIVGYKICENVGHIWKSI